MIDCRLCNQRNMLWATGCMLVGFSTCSAHCCCRPLPELGNGPVDEVSAAIGRNVAALIPNGACLQVCGVC